MEINGSKILYRLGTVLLVIVVLELTVFPLLSAHFFPSTYIPLLNHKKTAGAFYLAIFISYALSSEYFIKQVSYISFAFLFFVVFQYTFKFFI